ncbi:uncharacterized protein LOC110974995 [Acanthaster planci]|uniref:Uncharacterized protein LOC110974995 n=1 Tax=Acanthaster planci TaxID=133434 RepID=A0A8B7XPF8_ACAPL|nr:uncharacterized protein LOC110974995 [Acanthaster planci]
MPSQTKESSLAEPQLTSAIVVDPDRPATNNATGPSPVMPSLSPYPLAGEPHLGVIAERKNAAKKMLDFGDPADTEIDEGVKAIEDGGCSTEEVVSVQGELSPRNTDAEATQVSGLTTPQALDSPGSPHIVGRAFNTEHVSLTPPPLESSTLKRHHSVSPENSRAKHLCNTSPDFSDFFPHETSTSFRQPELVADLELGDCQGQGSSLPVFSRNSLADMPFLDFHQGAEGEAGDPEDVLRCHGINLFENPAHREELINFCQQSLAHSNEHAGDLNSNNNKADLCEGHDYQCQTAHDKLASVIQRARSKGFLVSDAMYFDGKQYVPIKVATNGRGKFRLLLPPDHPHRKGVAEEIPIFTTFEIDSSEDAFTQDDEEGSEQSHESN